VADATAQVRRDGATLVFSGALVRGVVAPLSKQARPLCAGAHAFDLRAVSQVDSAGLALLAELGDGNVRMVGEPAGFAELRAAYRLDETLGFAS
jgi:phospholipid transport system transporter-binding protein